MATDEHGDDPFDDLGEEYDAFFAEESTVAACGAGASSSTSASSGSKAQGTSGSEATQVTDIESEYELLSTFSPPQEIGTACGGANAASTHPTIATFALDDDDDNSILEMDMVMSGFQQDMSPPELPAAPRDFSSADLVLRESLADFYREQNAGNLASVNAIVEQYRGRGVPHLWVRLALKYRMQAAEAVELLAGTLYESSLFERARDQGTARLESLLGAQRLDALSEPSELLRSTLEAGPGGSEELLRALCFRGAAFSGPEELRPRAWKVLLGYLPMCRHSEWSTIETEKRALYASYRSEVLVVTGSNKIEVKVEGHRARQTLDMLQQIQKDVDRTRQDCNCFARLSARTALTSLLFVYAHRNPDVQYIQGMNEVAALIYYVMMANPEFAEADTFWCFTAMMGEMKAGLLQTLEQAGNGCHVVGFGHQAAQAAPAPPAPIARLERLLKAYAPELAQHLQKYECPVSVFAFRWCTWLFAQEAELPNIVRLWDSLIADPQRFDFVVHVSLAVLLAHRQQLLSVNEQGALAQMLRGAPQHCDFQKLQRLAWAVCALERRAQTPPFPMRSAGQFVHDLSGWAQKVTRNLQDNVAPAVKSKTGKAAGTAVAAAHGGARAVCEWFEQPEPIPFQSLERAQAGVASLWRKVGSFGAAAVSGVQRLGAVDAG